MPPSYLCALNASQQKENANTLNLQQLYPVLDKLTHEHTWKHPPAFSSIPRKNQKGCKNGRIGKQSIVSPNETYHERRKHDCIDYLQAAWPVHAARRPANKKNSERHGILASRSQQKHQTRAKKRPSSWIVRSSPPPLYPPSLSPLSIRLH